MIRHSVLLTCLLAAGAVAASDPQGFAIWNSAELETAAKKLAPKMNSQKVATEGLANYGNHEMIMVHREGSGQAELHVHMVDVFVIESGAATLIVGGKIPNPRTTAPGEVRGATIEGGSSHALAPGDVVHIPADTPHQVLVDPGKQVSYLAIKVQAR